MDVTTKLLNQRKINKIKEKPLRAPLIIVVAAAASDNPKALKVEDIAGANVSCQNILLSVDELGLAAIWRTGSMTYDADVANYLGFDEDVTLVGFLYIGYPFKPIKAKDRQTADQYTRWHDK